MSSKTVIAGLAAALAVVSGIALYYASVETQAPVSTIMGQESDGSAQFLFVQHASSGSLARDGDAYTLTLNGVSESTVRFADRPYRYVDSIATSSFVDQWFLGNDSFEDDPPNAALVLDDSGGQKTIIVELLNPVFDGGTQTLTYKVVAAGESGGFTTFGRDGSVNQEGDISGEFGQATLVIDDADEVFPVPHGTCYADGAIIDCSCELHYVQDGDKAACVPDTFS